jgi:hypothetical protein
MQYLFHLLAKKINGMLLAHLITKKCIGEGVSQVHVSLTQCTTQEIHSPYKCFSRPRTEERAKKVPCLSLASLAREVKRIKDIYFEV